ncbi:hypothetical protein SELMODRAFT_130235 [Selaginella moellendorffii]|uniref:DYW domain-containing protein n=2 Tax=Selaginella moellendorffii TaxID=88036 RepID=D8T229_SELML|nr:hypothetical protein SELMODRAFT_130235 [Selaginella moellendorffii]
MSTLRDCASKGDLEGGSQLHQQELSEPGVDSHVLIATQLIDMYGKCRDTEQAYAVFERMERKDVIAWNFMLGALVLRSKDKLLPHGFQRVEFGLETLRLFRRMLLQGQEPNAVTFTHAVNACASVAALSLQKRSVKAGRLLHELAASRGYATRDTILGNALIAMYYAFDQLDAAARVFHAMACKSSVTWTQLIVALTRSGAPVEGVVLHRMMQLEGGVQDRASLVAALDACANSAELLYGSVIHQQVLLAGLESDVCAGTAVVHMYAMCNRMETATRLFERIPAKNAYTWNSIITAYARRGDSYEALHFFERMVQDGTSPDKFTIVAAIDACAGLVALEYGSRVLELAKSAIQVKDVLELALANFYGKCMLLEVARDKIEGMAYKTTTRYTTLISAFADHGFVTGAAELYHSLNLEGLLPHAETFTALLAGSSHKGRLGECRSLYHSMITDFNIRPRVEHLRMVMQLLGRQGRVAKVEDLVNHSPFHPGRLDWLSLLTASEVHKDLPRARRAAREMLKLDSKDHLPYEILANMYVEDGMRAKAEEMIAKMRRYKQRQSSFIEIHGKVYRFLEGHSRKNHTMSRKLERFLERMRLRMTSVGYIFKASSEGLIRGKVEAERHHSERLAVAFGVIKLPRDAMMRICSKHRMCADCHAVIKYVSMLFQRKISVRDGSRAHLFEDGLCSCRDYW